jgi:formamidopyrimidine-DNA glycosylase
MRKKGIDLAWQRVFGYPDEAHVRFNHAPHIRANVECATCHGNIAEQTVAQRNVEMTMGFCVNCHRERKASLDCLACHY